MNKEDRDIIAKAIQRVERACYREGVGNLRKALHYIISQKYNEKGAGGLDRKTLRYARHVINSTLLLD